MSPALPWLHPQRADVLAALALVVRRREPLAPGFARLAEGDPLLRPWSERLAADLAAGQPLGTVLRRHRLLDRPAAARLDAAADPVPEFERLAGESLRPVRGLWLIRWLPVLLIVVMLVPVALVQVSGVGSVYANVYHDLNVKLPALTSAVLDRSLAGVMAPLLGGILLWGLLAGLDALRGLRHLRHLWWVEVHRQAALLELVEAAVAGDDRPVHLGEPWASAALLRLSAWRQDRPAWDRAWRTWRILTRWRILDPGWKEAARATTALGVLRALGLVAADDPGSGAELLRTSTRERLVQALAVARAEAKAMLILGFGFGLILAMASLYLPLLSIMTQLNGGG